jgi:hypothetical protein
MRPLGVTVLWRIEADHWDNPWGDRVTVDRVLERVEATACGTIEKDNGYTKYQARVVIDLTTSPPRVWWKRQTVDYWGLPYWIRIGRDDRVKDRQVETWVDRLPLRSVWADGTPVTPWERDVLNEGR